jgi:hypothetical protein
MEYSMKFEGEREKLLPIGTEILQISDTKHVIECDTKRKL